MNWTEGNLSRHSRGGQRNELLARQKQHFAKVRNGLLRGPAKQSPISMSFLTSHQSPTRRHHGRSADVSRSPPSSPLLVEKRKRARPSQDGPPSQSSIREKRRRLLDKADWAGLDLQQPIDITFPGQLQPASGPRWRTVDRPKAHHVQRSRKVRRISPFEASQPVHTRPMKIQIGSQEIQPAWGTSSQPGAKRYSLAPQPLAGSSLRSNTISSPAPSQARQLYVTTGSSGGISQIHKGPRSGRAREYSNGSPLTTSTELLIPEEPTHFSFASSVIQEPVPLRASNFHVLGWSPSRSESRGSLQVEIERPAEPFSLSQHHDQERWKNLAMGSSSYLTDEHRTGSQTGIPSTSINTNASLHLQGGSPSYDVFDEVDSLANIRDFDADTSQQTEEDSRRAVREVEIQVLKPGQEPAKPQKGAEPVDDNSAWMKFAFGGDSDDLEEKAFEEAARQAAAELCYPRSPTGFSGAAADVSSRETAMSFDNAREQIGANSITASSESHMATRGTDISESVTSNVATAGSVHVVDSESQFRFAMPRTFVGKLASSDVTAQGPLLLSRGGSKRRGRPRKKAADGRTDIRRLPDFDGDPIEDFED
ncbi:hypothetical protein GGR52DRAFT_312679 [Hypoxylon sp. FL1284]|nr:hypothetical protein GGR52DRAFT_312679 [Hypoxylon sp. FL1284]